MALSEEKRAEIDTIEYFDLMEKFSKLESDYFDATRLYNNQFNKLNYETNCRLSGLLNDAIERVEKENGLVKVFVCYEKNCAEQADALGSDVTSYVLNALK